jgi:hypothetical protein
MKKQLLAVLTVLMIPIFILTAEDDELQPPSPTALPQTEETEAPAVFRYDTGTQFYSLSAAPLFSLGISFPASQTPPDRDSMKTGGYISIGWEAFFNHTVSVGLELGYGFAKAVDDRRYNAVPVLVKGSYYLLDGIVNVPVSLSAGLVYSSFDSQRYLGIMLKPEIAAIVSLDDKWGIGLRTAYIAVPELYFGDDWDKSAVASFLTVQAAVTYGQ